MGVELRIYLGFSLCVVVVDSALDPLQMVAVEGVLDHAHVIHPNKIHDQVWDLWCIVLLPPSLPFSCCVICLSVNLLASSFFVSLPDLGRLFCCDVVERGEKWCCPSLIFSLRHTCLSLWVYIQIIG